MKTCTNCKAVNDDSSNFCQYCGSNSFEQQNPQQGYSGQSPNFQAFQNGGQTINPAKSVIKSIGSSTLFLSAVILFTVYVVFRFITELGNVLTYSPEDLENSLNSFSLNIDSIASTSNTYNILYTILTYVPKILTCVGLWLVRKSCTDNTVTLDAKSIKFLRTTILVIFIATLLSLIMVGVFSINLLQNFDFETDFEYPFNYGFDTEMSDSIISSTIAVIVFLIGGIITLMTFYYTKIMKTLGSIQNVIITGVASDYISMFVVVMNYIFAFFTFLSMFSSGVLGFFANGCFVAFLIIFSILLIKYRNEMRTVIFRHQYSFTGDNTGFTRDMY
jgi:hypothetical protein